MAVLKENHEKKMFREADFATLKPIFTDAHKALLDWIEDQRQGARELGDTSPESTARTSINYVDPVRIQELKSIDKPTYDPKRLVRLCEELNDCYARKNFFAVAMLVRAIMDHIPPVFGETAFEQVVSNQRHRSFKGNMSNLQKSMRHIADSFLHEHIRRNESLPTETQIDAKRDLDVLLQEVAQRFHGST